jgi:riboflavin synthase
LLDGHRAVGGEEEVGLVDGDRPCQRLGQLDDDGVAVAEHRRVRRPGRLGGEGRIELGHPAGPANGRAAREWVMDLIGVVDTMFARYDMGAEAVDELSECPGYGTRFTVVRRTVPGFKDLAVAAKKLIEEEGCRIVVALGMPGKEKVDKVCAHEASTGIMTAQLMTNTPILEVFVHEDESDDPATLAMVFKNRSRDHARNAYLMLYEPEALTARAGQGIRQGFAHAGPLEL